MSISKQWVSRALVIPLLALSLLALAPPSDAAVRVRGYTRKDGTYVQPHYRSNPDSNPYNNYSFPGNLNPYTGKIAPGNPDTYLENYYGNNSGRSSSYLSSPSLSLPTVQSLTYPSLVLGASTDIEDSISVFLDDIPLIVNHVFESVFERKSESVESQYWKTQIRNYNIGTRSQLWQEMQDHHLLGYTYGGLSPEMKARAIGLRGKVLAAQTSTLEKKINAIFRAAYGRNPAPPENRYWLSRIADKPSEQAMKDAMAYHKAAGIPH